MSKLKTSTRPTNTEHHVVEGSYIPSRPVQATPATTMAAGVYRIGVVKNPDVGVNQYAFVPHDIQTDHLVRIADSNAARAIDEIKRFWPLKARFQQFGFMHKRGILMHGPPGTGKTTTMNLVMEDVVQHQEGIVVIGESVGTLVLMLQNLRQVEPERRVLVVIEDLDQLVREDEETLLALLDGDKAVENVVYLATTNYLSQLPPRILERPSRFDVIIEVKGPNAAARRAYLESRGIDGDLDRWVTVSEGIISMAHLKELIISVELFGNDLQTEASRLRGKAFTVADTDTDDDTDDFDGGDTKQANSLFGIPSILRGGY